MSEITQLREQLASAVNELPGEKVVTLGPCDYAQGEKAFIVQITVGENTPANQEAVDEMYESFPEAIDASEVANITFVSKCSGHRLYATFPGAPVQLGCEWTIKVL